VIVGLLQIDYATVFILRKCQSERKNFRKDENFDRGAAPWCFVRFRKLQASLDTGSRHQLNSDPCYCTKQKTRSSSGFFVRQNS